MEPRDADPDGQEKSETIRVGDYSFTVNPDIADNPKFVELKAYWDAKRAARHMPTRSAIDPLDLRGHLGSLILAEILPDRSDIRWRLIGTNIVEAHGFDPTGKLLSEVNYDRDPDYRRFLRLLLHTVAERGVIIRAHGPLKAFDRAWRHFDSLSLPLDAGDGTVGMILTERLMWD